MSQIIKIEKVNLWYDKGKPTEVHALKDISIGIEKGDYVAFFGPSGCGKTTMLYAISGIDRFQEGKVLINNRDISGLSNQELAIFRQTGIGIVFQQFNLVPSLNVLKNVALPMLFVGITSEKAEIEARKLLERLDMLQYADRLPYELSGGQQQRIGIARALANNPPIIIADEPLGNLDSKNAKMVLEFLKELNEKDGRTVIMVTHESWSLRDVKTIFHMKDGVIIDTEKTKMNPSSDAVPPVITLTGSNPMMVVKNTKYIEPGAVALDIQDGICPVTISGVVDTSTLGSYTITYTSTDKAGNVATAMRTVKVVLTTFDIVATSGPYGTVAPFGITLAKYKSSQTYSITPDNGFKVDTLTVDGVNLEVANTFTFLNIDRSHTITATFSDITPPVITLNGADPMSVTKDSTYNELGAIALDALDGKCEVTISGSVDTSTLGSYTITYTSRDKAGNVATKTRIINVTLSPTYDITATGGAHGVISPGGVTAVPSGSDQTYTITPDDGFKIATLTVDGIDLATVSTHTFKDVVTSHTIDVRFSDVIPPVIILNGEDTMLIIKGGEYIEQGATAIDALDGKCEVTISGVVDTSTLGSYTITYTSTDKAGNVATKTRIINVTLSPTYDITATGGAHGVISPGGVTAVPSGSDQTYTITPDDGFEIDTLIVDGISIVPVIDFKFENVKSTHKIDVMFKELIVLPEKDTDTDIDIDDNIKYNKEEKPSIRVLANYLLRGSMDEVRRFETFVNDKFDEKISKEEFCILLNKQFKDGGVGLRKKKAEKIANYLEEIVEKRKIIRRIYSILDENPEASISDEINSIRNWLMKDYKGKVSQVKVMAFDQVISDRIRDFIPASKVVEILDLSNNKFGVGFSFRAAQSMAEKLELILSNENDKSNSDNVLEKKL